MAATSGSGMLVFRLKSATKLEVVRFDGKTIKARDARVIVATRIGCNDLEVDLYRGETLLTGDEDLITSSQVEVVRKLPNTKLKAQSEIQKNAKKVEDSRRMFGGALPAAGPGAGGPTVIAGADEEEQLRILSTASRDQGPGAGPQFMPGGGGGRGRGGGGMMMGAIPNRPPPPGYICHACGKSGHYIEHCPESGKADGKRYTLPVGIAESNLQRVDASDPTAKFVTKDGHWVKRRLDGSAFVSAGAADESEAPADLKCQRCHRVFVDAMLLPCCSGNICSPCLDSIVEAAQDDPPACPLCDEVLLAMECTEAVEMRRKVDAWKADARAKRQRDPASSNEGKESVVP